MAKALSLDWHSEKNFSLFNPKLPQAQWQVLQSRVSMIPKDLKGHIFLSTSGSTGNAKIVALSKTAMMISARAVNAHLQASDRDKWLLALPSFHVGGLSIFARAELTGSTVHRLETWSPELFVRLIEDKGITLSSLVPTQIFDLIRRSQRAPENLRAIVVGGGALGKNLYHMARQLGWPLLPSYGLTEACSQVATASLNSLEPELAEEDYFPDLEVLPHFQVSLSRDGHFVLKGLSLLTGYLDSQGHVLDPKTDGHFLTEDRGFLVQEEPQKPQCLRILGRGQDWIKVSGENVDLLHLEDLAQKIALEKSQDLRVAIAPIPEERLGFELHLVLSGLAENSQLANEILSRFNSKVAPFEKLRAFRFVKEIPQTASGKKDRPNLVRQLAKPV